jgi:hypothetical protein
MRIYSIHLLFFVQYWQIFYCYDKKLLWIMSNQYVIYLTKFICFITVFLIALQN